MQVATPQLGRCDTVAGAPGLKVCVVGALTLGGAGHLTVCCPCSDRACLPGAAGGIGQPLALLLKLSPRVHTLHLYDVVNTAGVKADVSHINTTARVRGVEVASQEGARCGPL
jgi:hypothetical protein